MAKGKKNKQAYPQKRTMNLYYKPDRTTVPATVALYVLFALTLLLAFGKFFVYDKLEEIRERSEVLASLQYEQSLYEDQLSDYDEVLQRYRLYSVTEDEERQTDRMEILELVDTVIRPNAKITGFSVSDGYVNVSFSGVTLKQTAEIVRTLDQSPLVLRTTVNTAATEQSTEGSTAGLSLTAPSVNNPAADGGAVDTSAGTDTPAADGTVADGTTGNAAVGEDNLGDIFTGEVSSDEAAPVDGAEGDAGIAPADGVASDAGTAAGNGEAGAAGATSVNGTAGNAGISPVNGAMGGATAADGAASSAVTAPTVGNGYDASAATGNWVTANILIVLQKENETNETTTVQP